LTGSAQSMTLNASIVPATRLPASWGSVGGVAGGLTLISLLGVP
jgi:hypothetical protein